MATTEQKVYRNNWVEKDPNYGIEFLESPRRVRVMFAGEAIADTTRARLMREPKHVPVYYFPREDVRMDLATPSDNHSHCPWKGHCSYYSITVGGKTAENAMWSYEDPYPEIGAIKDYVAFYWDRVDQWLEEDEEIFVHARDPYKRVDTCLSHREVRVMLAGEEVARSTDARFLFETNHQVRYYLPESDVRMDLMERSATRTSCPYKGDAVYFSARINGELLEDVAWSYPDPIPECPKIKGLICFFNERVDDILVDGRSVPKVETKWSRK
ncbi:MAG: DUF427 domain-containing protein [Alphaproteobacteria bacterium]|nr:DUF427 domain-containing protein [Alphaproteobacteria bacterium]